MFATLWAALFMKSYLLSLLFSALQLGAMVLYVSAAYGGAEAAMRMLSMCFGAARSVVRM
jgi:hypothetical protein